MELLLKGNIKKIGGTFGIIKSENYNEEHFFIKSDIIKSDRKKIKLGDSVSFELKTNSSRGSNAYRIKIDTSEEISSDLEQNNSLKKIGVSTIFEEIFDNRKAHVLVKEFQKFLSEGFYILESNNQQLNELIKLVVHDNIITDIEKVFLKEKIIELGFPSDLLEKVNDYMFSNNPYFDNILEMIFKDGIIKENEIAFLIEKAKENSFTSSFINNRFWQYSFSLHLEVLLKYENIVKIIKLWYLSQNTKFGLSVDKDWVIMQLNILKNTKIEKNIDRTLDHFENTIFPFLVNKYNISFVGIEEIYDHIVLDFTEEKDQIIKSIKSEIKTSLSSKKLYKKEDIYNIFSVPEEQQKGKWNNGYCEHNGEWFIFTNIGQTGHGYNEIQGFDYNNSLDQFGDLNWEAINNSKLSWDSIQKLKTSSPFIFIRKPETKKHYWEYLGKGSCLYTFDTTPVEFKWKITSNNINQDNHISKKAALPNVKKKKRPAHRLKSVNKDPKKTIDKKISNHHKNLFKKLYKNNPFEAFNKFKKYAQINLKIKQNSKIKKIWNEEIIIND